MRNYHRRPRVLPKLPHRVQLPQQQSRRKLPTIPKFENEHRVLPQLPKVSDAQILLGPKAYSPPCYDDGNSAIEMTRSLPPTPVRQLAKYLPSQRTFSSSLEDYTDLNESSVVLSDQHKVFFKLTLLERFFFTFSIFALQFRNAKCPAYQLRPTIRTIRTIITTMHIRVVIVN